MPKVLSLKKAQQVAPPKNQRAITQFFKNTNISTSQKPQKSPAKSQASQGKCAEQKPVKRKAVSPVNIETIEIVNEPNVKNTSNIHSKHQYGLHTPKKLKTDGPSNKNEIFGKKSPQKENGITSRNSQRKNHDDYHTILLKEDKNTYNHDVDIKETKNRSPLTPLENENVEWNKINNLIINENIIKSCSTKIENGSHGPQEIIKTPKKVLQFESCIETNTQISVRNKTSMKSPINELCPQRIAKLKTPEKLTQEELSPSKSGSTVKTLTFSPNGVEDMFGEEWDVGDMEENCTEDLDLSTMQRCEVTSVTRHPTKIELRLKNSSNNRGTCCVEGIWLDTPLAPGEVVSVIASRDSNGQFTVGNNCGLLVLRPDHLMSSTSVVAGVFCKRKALLQERWRGIDSANTAMTMGILIHELVQKALTQNIADVRKLQAEADNLIKESVQILYETGITEEEARMNMLVYIGPLAEFMEQYVLGKPTGKPQQKDQWRGHVDKVLDIEENMCCPQLGLKGKIDATLQVTIHERNGHQQAIVPLELKSGKPSVSAEHRGQLVLYGMMLGLQRGAEPTRAQQRGLLLYLKERVELREVSCGYPERRDLVMLRNQLVQYLAPAPDEIDPEQITDIEDASILLQQKLPEPVHHQTACAKCPYLTLCSLHLWHTDGPSVTECHPLSKLRKEALGHLSKEHIKYFLHWTALLKMEERCQMTVSPLHALWTDSVEKRTKRGTCASNLKLKSVESSGDRFLHHFNRPIKHIDTLNGKKNTKGPQEGEFSIVSLDSRPWIAAGVVSLSNEKEISIILERDLSRRLSKDTAFHIDTYESYATTVHNLTNLGVLLEDSDRALRLRKLIIDKEPPQFEGKLPREVGRLGTKLMRSLNIQQQRAVLRALAAKDYALLQGLPGTGKTQTISVLIQMLVGLKQRVLVTAHTHSAVDTVLSRLPKSLRVMRLGSSTRVADCLKNRCEQHLIAGCKTAQELEQLYDSMEVIGVTCLGATHGVLSRGSFVCVMDEATQVLQSTALRPLLAASKFVLVGDPDQLPPVVRSRAARRLGMEESLFHRLMCEQATCTLQLQYRMNQALVDVANTVAYNARLKCADSNVATAKMTLDVEKLSRYNDVIDTRWLLEACSPELQHAAMFIDIKNIEISTKLENNKSCANVDEACVVMALVEALIQGGVNPSDVGVIAPYRDQVSLLRRPLQHRGVECSTVDQFQGRDKSVIVYTCTKRDEDERAVKEGEILNDQRRLAVSVTRAKHKLLVVGNSRALQRYTPLQKLIDTCTTLLLEKNVIKFVLNKYRTQFV